jgi:fructokinase
MKPKIAVNSHKKPICIGTGLVALDVVINSGDTNSTQFYAGGSCGNVLTILSYFGWDSYPIARLSNNVAADLLMQDFSKWQVKDGLLTFTEDGSTPIIIHRILKDKLGTPKHRFEFRNPEDGSYLPSYKPCLAKSVPSIVIQSPKPNIFFFDRINRASIDLAKEYKSKGAIIYFEPSSAKDVNGFRKCLEIADVVKFSEDRIPEYDSLQPIATTKLEIQTLGAKGIKYRKKGASKWIFVSGYAIENVIDSAGAGDWFTAGFLYWLFRRKVDISKIPNELLLEALNFGQVSGSLNCTFEGARGLMYNVNRNDLVLLIEHLVSSGIKIIPPTKHVVKPKRTERSLKISSLFAHM